MGSCPRSTQSAMSPISGSKRLSPVDQAQRKDKLRVAVVFHLYRHFALGEHVTCLKSELEGVSQVHRHRNRAPVTGVLCRLDGRSGRQHPCGAGQVHRNRVNVYAGHREPQPFQHLFGVKSGSFGSVDEVRNRLRDESPGAAGWVEDILVLCGSVTTSRTMARASQSGV